MWFFVLFVCFIFDKRYNFTPVILKVMKHIVAFKIKNMFEKKKKGNGSGDSHITTMVC